MKLIDAAPLMEDGWHLVKTGRCNVFLASMSLADVQTVDAVEVVRCKDCKYWDEQNKELYTYDSKPENKDNMVDFAECLHWSCWSTCHSTRFNDFCSLGERRNDG